MHCSVVQALSRHSLTLDVALKVAVLVLQAHTAGVSIWWVAQLCACTHLVADGCALEHPPAHKQANNNEESKVHCGGPDSYEQCTSMA